ncbi:MAG: MarC family protein [Nitratireductor sp.]|nr:MarC family protein [Nitratireductor sp.]
MITTDTLLNAFVTLFVTIDPPGLAPLFLGLTAGMTRAERYSVAFRGTAIAVVLLIVFSMTGTAILSLMGITIHAFRLAGGLLLFYIAFEMIFEKRQERHEKTTEVMSKEHIASIAVFPLAIPLIAGPGAISATILLSTQMATDIQGRIVLIAIILAVIGLVLLAFFAAEAIDKYLGQTGRNILTRLLGVLLAALAVQFVADGAIALFASKSA